MTEEDLRELMWFDIADKLIMHEQENFNFLQYHRFIRSYQASDTGLSIKESIRSSIEEEVINDENRHRYNSKRD